MFSVIFWIKKKKTAKKKETKERLKTKVQNITKKERK